MIWHKSNIVILTVAALLWQTTAFAQWGYNQTPLMTKLAMEAEAAKQKSALPYTDPNKQFKIECPPNPGLALPPPPEGFTLTGNVTTASLSTVEVSGSVLSCGYTVSQPSATLMKSISLYQKYQYSAAGKQCGPSAYPCNPGSCTMVCNK